jgi:gluconolactonase
MPDGIKADIEGNVWVACGDGVRAYSPEGQLLGLINIPGGCSNFVFVGGKEVLMANEYKLYRAKLGVQGAYLTEKHLKQGSK